MIADEGGSGVGLGKEAGLSAVETLKASQKEVISANDFRLLRVVSIAGHRGVDLEQMFGYCYLHLNQISHQPRQSPNHSPTISYHLLSAKFQSSG
jgi:hypothetical protein